ncbi:hypothetical protein AAGW04_16135, partial [Pectobacterium aroidearum]|uniref:hypothetical protein n=1 Tax=Pectobacterium aroidearum TaxID=1201031 RepID=UPI003158144C
MQLVVLRRNINMRRWRYAMYSNELIDLDHKQCRRLRSFCVRHRSLISLPRALLQQRLRFFHHVIDGEAER